MGVKSVKGSHPRYNRTFEGIIILRAIQSRGGPISEVSMHVHDATGALSVQPSE